MTAVLRSLVVEAGLASITALGPHRATITVGLARRGSSRIDGAAGHVRDVVHRAIRRAVVLKWLVVKAGLASITALGPHRGTWS